MPARKPAPPPNADDPEQSRRFIDMAREIEADESPGATDRAFDKVIKAPAKGPDQSAKGRRPGSSHPRGG
jgi:hypothetical protein